MLHHIFKFNFSYFIDEMLHLRWKHVFSSSFSRSSFLIRKHVSGGSDAVGGESVNPAFFVQFFGVNNSPVKVVDYACSHVKFGQKMVYNGYEIAALFHWGYSFGSSKPSP